MFMFFVHKIIPGLHYHYLIGWALFNSYLMAWYSRLVWWHYANPYILACLTSLFVAQALKPFVSFWRGEPFSWRRMFQSGGMPSSHSALVSSLAASLGMAYGFNSPMFQLSFALGSIVIYDAMGVRRLAGEHSRILNQLLAENKVIIPKPLPELVGHSPLEVLVGVALGIGVALLVMAR